MCGLSAVLADRLTPKYIDAFNTLMLLSNLRGADGAGVIGATVSGKIYKHKTIGTGLDLIRDQSYHRLVSGKRDEELQLLIGHTRFPTKGSVQLKNTHPMDAKNVIGVHNGTMIDVYDRFATGAQSDSAMLYDAISEFGIEETMSKSEGAYALMYVDKVKKVFHVLRNVQRTLHQAIVSENGEPVAMFLSSEAGMLRYALGRCGITNIEVRDVPTNTLMSFPLLPNKDDLQPATKEIRSVERYKRHPYVGMYSSSDRSRDLKTTYIDKDGYRVFEYQDGTRSTVYVGHRKEATREGDVPFGSPAGLVGTLAEKMKAAAAERRYKKMPNAEPLALPPPDPARASRREDAEAAFAEPYTMLSNGHFVSAARLSELLNKGCAWCSQTVLGSEVSLGIRKPFFFNTEEYVCDDCKDIPDVVEFVGDWKKRA
jgi:hypothetical protein